MPSFPGAPPDQHTHRLLPGTWPTTVARMNIYHAARISYGGAEILSPVHTVHMCGEELRHGGVAVVTRSVAGALAMSRPRRLLVSWAGPSMVVRLQIAHQQECREVQVKDLFLSGDKISANQQQRSPHQLLIKEMKEKL